MIFQFSQDLNPMRLSFPGALLLLAFAVPIAAQDAIPQISQSTASECTEESFEQAERSFKRRKFSSNNLVSAEQQLSKVVRLCKEQPGGFQAEDHLRVVHEDLADHNLYIALFYLGKFFEGKSGKAGALGRLKNIVEKYPEYSKLDQVLFLLGELNMKDRNFDEAASYYQRLIEAYPGSQYIGEASMHLSAIGVLKIETTAQPIP
jgi:TolA-binding protein